MLCDGQVELVYRITRTEHNYEYHVAPFSRNLAEPHRAEAVSKNSWPSAIVFESRKCKSRARQSQSWWKITISGSVADYPQTKN